MADAQSFAPVVEAISRAEPVLILDRRGRSPSGPLGEGYSVATEASDLTAWIDHLAGAVTLVGWSYGATIALEVAATDKRVQEVVGYEPVLGPFGRDAMTELRDADLNRRVEIVNLDISRFPQERVEALRSSPAWPTLCRLSEPLPDELAALNAFRPKGTWSSIAAELILGENNLDAEPYGPAFERVRTLLPHSTTTILPGQGHLAHVDAPAALGKLISELITRTHQHPAARGAF
ncbi:alpha/beta fold hydrolase [Epidermidibacterium keratini]